MQATSKSNRPGLIEILFLAYTLVIVYASLSPFIGWRMPVGNVFHFLTVWPRYITRYDVIINIVAYIPLSFMAALSLCRRKIAVNSSMLWPIILAMALGAMLSLAMETLQVFIPGRVAAVPDLLANTLGSLIGAVMAQPYLSAYIKEYRNREDA